MTEFKIKVEDQIVQTIGYLKIESFLKEVVSNLQLKMSAKEMLEGTKDIDFENDPSWQIAREIAWKEADNRHSSLSSKRND